MSDGRQAGGPRAPDPVAAQAASVAFVELYRQWPGYFCDSFQAVQAGDLVRAGHHAEIFKAFMHQTPASVCADLCAELRARGPFRWLVVDRIWDRELLATIREAAGSEHVVVNQWASPAGWPEVDHRISPISRAATLALVSGEPIETIPNLWTRDGGGRWRPPEVSEALEVAREFAEPLALCYDAATVLGIESKEARAHRYLVLNMGCPYRGASNTSGFLDGLELATAWGADGCTFCNVGSYERQTPAERRALMERQLEAIAPHGIYRRLVVQDEYVFRDLDVLASLVREHAPEGVEVMVRARVAYLESCRPQLERALELLEGHATLSPYLIGFENFSDAELARYNKGQTGAEGEAAVRLLDELADRYPGLRISKSQGFILFGPWTTLEDLEINLGALRRVRFDRLRGRITRTKLRLNPDAALLARARADGLIEASHGRPDEDNAADAGYEAEIPYHFQDPRTERVWELLNGPHAVSGGSEIGRLARALERVRRESGGAAAA